MHPILRSQETGKGCILHQVTSMEMASLKRNSEMHYIFDIVRRTPPNLPTHCDGCLAKFSIAHSLEYKKKGLVIQHHDEIQFELLVDLAARALIPSVVRDEPQIYPGRSADVEETDGMSTIINRRTW